MTAIQYNALVQRARNLMNERRHTDCRTICAELLRLRKNDPQALLMLAQLEWTEGRRQQAVVQLQKYVRLYPKDIQGRFMLAGFCIDRGRNREAIAQYEKVLKLAPKHPEAIRGIARAHDRSGEVEKAIALLDPYIEQRTATPAMALVYATIEMNRRNYERAVEVGLPYAMHPQADAPSAQGLWFVIGQCYERLDEIDKSFEAYRRANSIEAPAFDPDEYDRTIDEIIEVYSAERLARLPRAAHGSSRPVFIACRPRSGSTLIDRIVGSHPAIHSAGEHNDLSQLSYEMPLIIGSTAAYPSCVSDLDQNDVNELASRYLDVLEGFSPSAQRITNKHLRNWELLGLAEVLFPESHIIDLRRDRVDNTLACWMIDLGLSFPYSYSLEHLGRVHRAYERLMDHWHNVLSVPMLTVNYEDIVADQEGWSRRIIEFLGLEWHEDVLRFHEVGEKKGSDTPTLSYAQVRQPVYKTSVGRAQKFEKHIGPLLAALGE